MDDRIQAIGNAFYRSSSAVLEGYTEHNGIITAYFETTTRTIIDHEIFSFPATLLESGLSDAEIAKQCISVFI